MTFSIRQKFSTQDKDNDPTPDDWCAQTRKGAWWYKNCHFANLNGFYYSSENFTSRYSDGVVWSTWKSWWSSMRFTEMKLRPYDV